MAKKKVHNVAAYARYSTDNQTENSIEYQLAKIKEYCVVKDYNIVMTFKDEARSGTNTNRQSFIALLGAARLHQFDAIVIYNISRGSRDVGDWFAFRKEMAVLGIEIISVEDKLGDLLNPGDFLSELVNVGVGFHQVLKTREDSIHGVTNRAKDGVFLGGVAPYGYKIINQQYVIEPAEAEIVRNIFSWYAMGKSYNYILKQLEGLTGRRGAAFGGNTLHSILSNERYVGTYFWNKRHVKTLGKWAGGRSNENCVKLPGGMPAIVDEHTWGIVQERLKSNKGNARNKAIHQYLLTGLIECESCGAKYISHTSTNSKGYKIGYYYCGNRYRTHTCSSPNMRLDVLEGFVIEHVKKFALSLDQEAADMIAQTVQKAMENCDAERKELMELNEKIKNATNAILSGVVYPELITEVNAMRDRRDKLDQKIHNTQQTCYVDTNALRQMFVDNIQNGAADIAALIRAYVLKIKIHPDSSFTLILGVHLSSCGGRI